MTDFISREAVLEILRTPTSVDTFPDMIARVEALKFYADLSHEGPWHLPSEDYGKRARSALAAYEGVKG